MRSSVINGIKSLAYTGFSVSDELPFSDAGVELYTKNPKRFYVDKTQFASTPIVQTLNGVNINNTTTSVTVYFTVDAKNTPAQLDTIIDGLRGIEDTLVLDGTHTRESIVSSSYLGDMLVVEVEYRLTRIN
jgi:hypothetical protein